MLSPELKRAVLFSFIFNTDEGRTSIAERLGCKPTQVGHLKHLAVVALGKQKKLYCANPICQKVFYRPKSVVEAALAKNPDKEFYCTQKCGITGVGLSNAGKRRVHKKHQFKSTIQ